jgi:hypothetical protein
MLGKIAPTVKAPLPALTRPLPLGTSPSHSSTACLENTAIIASDCVLRDASHVLSSPTEDDDESAHDSDSCACQVRPVGPHAYNHAQPHEGDRDAKCLRTPAIGDMPTAREITPSSPTVALHFLHYRPTKFVGSCSAPSV